MGRDRRGRHPVDDPELVGQLTDLAAQRPTYGYRRLWALIRRLRAARGQGLINAKPGLSACESSSTVAPAAYGRARVRLGP